MENRRALTHSRTHAAEPAFARVTDSPNEKTAVRASLWLWRVSCRRAFIAIEPACDTEKTFRISGNSRTAGYEFRRPIAAREFSESIKEFRAIQ
jgi:hypothetical protein